MTHVAQEVQVGPRFVQTCLQTVVETKLQKKGRTLDEQAKLPTPRSWGSMNLPCEKGIGMIRFCAILIPEKC